MYSILRTQIVSGNYRLEDITYKINVLWVQEQLTTAEKDELLQLAVEYLDPAQERPETQAMLEALAARVTALEGRVDVLEGGGSTGGGTTDYPVWKPWDGMSSDYQPGAIVSHNGKLWVSVHNGQNTWEPGVTGTEALWQEYTPEEE